jgi:hypothetical protein
MRGKIASLAGTINKHLKTTIIHAFINENTPALWQRVGDEYYKRGKVASDIVGMITRMAFCLGAIVLLSRKLNDHNNWFDTGALTVTLLSTLLILMYLTRQVIGIVYTYFLYGTSAFRRQSVKILLAIVSTFLIIMFIRGMLILVGALSNATLSIK